MMELLHVIPLTGSRINSINFCTVEGVYELLASSLVTTILYYTSTVVRRSGLLLTVFELVGHGFYPYLLHEIFTFYSVDSSVGILWHLLLNKLFYKFLCHVFDVFNLII